jgi:hypothetical protein
MSSELYELLKNDFSKSESDSTLERFHAISEVCIAMRYIDKENLPNDALYLLENQVVKLLQKEDCQDFMKSHLNEFCLRMIGEKKT